MNFSRHRFFASLTPGVWWVLVLWVTAWLAEILGLKLHAFDLLVWLDLDASAVWHGQVWRLLTYAFFPAGIISLIWSCFTLVVVGVILERLWKRGQFWLYCLVAAVGSALVKMLLDRMDPASIFGTGSVGFALLIAWGFLCGRETVILLSIGETTVWKVVLVLGAINLLAMFVCCGLIMMLVMASGGVIGFIYLWLRRQWLMNRAGSVVHSERIQRLEL